MPTSKTRQSVPELGSDRANTDLMSQDVDFEVSETEERQIISYREILGSMGTRMQGNGYHLRPSPMGQWCGHQVYVKSKLKGLKGLKTPEDFFYYREIYPNVAGDAQGFYAALDKSGCEVYGKWERKAFGELRAAFLDDLSNPRSCAAKTTHNRYCPDATVRTLTGTQGCYKLVPPKSWFPDELQGLESRSLLTLLPDAEAHQLMLILGRVVAGANGTVTAEGVINHTARAYALIVGTEAGMGKSTFLNWLLKTLGLLGYSTTQLNSDFNKFGWASIATSDLAAIDDLTDDVQRKMINDNRVKTITSGGLIKTEEKGQPATEVRATSVLLGCTNMTNYSHYIGMDSGSLSRLNQLDTYNSYELARQYPHEPDARILPYWRKVCDRLKTTPEVLTAKLLRDCLDLFLAETGYSFDALGQLEKQTDQDNLETTMKANRESFRIDVSLRHAEELTDVAAHLVACAISQGKPRKQPKYLTAIERLDFNPDLLLCLMELFSSEIPSLPEALKIHEISYDCRKYFKAKLTDLKQLAAAKSSEQAFTIIVGELRSNKGFGYPSKSSFYQPRWLQQRRLIFDLMRLYEDQELDEALLSICEDVEKILDLLISL
jgi:Family of unknown function (DUF5906)